LSNIAPIDAGAVRKAYARWAPVYDFTFGLIADAGRISAVNAINRRQGRVLEVGVGTGISLPRYKSHLDIIGIDLSPDMLGKARDRIVRRDLENSQVLEMDAGALEFADDTFDTVVAMYVMTVVPDPETVMAELERVCKPGGEVIIVNHFSQDHGLRGMIERALTPLAAALGWRPEFPVETIMGQDRLTLVRRERMQPLGLFTMLRFVKDDPSMPASLDDEPTHAIVGPQPLGTRA